jgi:peptide/nickel transport system permease protein
VFSYIVRRLIATIPVMGVVAIFVFSLLYFAPGDPAAIIAGDLATAQDIARIHHQLGLDEPFLVRFWQWAWGVLRGDLGISIFTNQPVWHLIQQRLEPTAALTVTTLIVSVGLAIPIGVLAAWRAGTWIDRAVMGFAVLGFSVPSFVLAYVLILIFSVEFDWLPVQGYTSITAGFWPFLQHLILPSAALGLIYAALIARITRASMLEVLSQDYIRTAHAKGLSSRNVLIGHALNRHRRGAADRRRHRDGDRVRDPRHRPAHGRCDPAPRLPHHTGRHPAVLFGLCDRQSAGGFELHRARSAREVLTP